MKLAFCDSQAADDCLDNPFSVRIRNWLTGIGRRPSHTRWGLQSLALKTKDPPANAALDSQVLMF